MIFACKSHPSAKFIEARLAVGHEILCVNRRGKYLIIGLSDQLELIIHLGMTGRLCLNPPTPSGDHVRAMWKLDSGNELLFSDVRRFGRIRVMPAGHYGSIPTLAQLGPEPFDETFSPDHLHRALSASSRRVKTQLLSQIPVAGIGNIYADEALWAAQIYPASRSVTRPAASRLQGAIIEVLQRGISHGGTTLRDYRNADGEPGRNQPNLCCYGRVDEPCLRCSTLLRRRVWDQRSTTWCPRCQRR